MGMAETTTQQENIPLVMTAWGITACFGGIYISPLSDHLGRKMVMCLGCSVFLLSLFITNIIRDNTTQSYTYHGVSVWSYVCGLLYGLADSVLNTQVYATLGDLYPDTSTHAFRTKAFLHTIGSAIMFALPLAFTSLIRGDPFPGKQCSATNQPKLVKTYC